MTTENMAAMSASYGHLEETILDMRDYIEKEKTA